MIRNRLVSVIITTKNEEKNIFRLLQSINKQTYPRIQIIVVDNNSSDKTIKIAKKFTKNIFYKGPERSVQRNFGAKKAKGGYLLILDADMELSHDVVKSCVEVMKKEKCGAIIIPEESIANSFWEKTKAFERSFYNKEGDSSTDAARFFRKDLFWKVGGYDESITGPEDWDLPETMKNQGANIGRIKSKIFHYERINSLVSLGQKKFYYALKSNVYLKKQKISVLSPKTIYFLRPVFYKNWQKLIKYPILTLGMFIMMSVELTFGGFGYLLGQLRRNNR